MIDGKICNDYLDIAEAFNTYFSTVADKISAKNSENILPTPVNDSPLNDLKQVSTRPFPSINMAPTSTKAITEIVK
jgi:hypothetical protein